MISIHGGSKTYIVLGIVYGLLSICSIELIAWLFLLLQLLHYIARIYLSTTVYQMPIKTHARMEDVMKQVVRPSSSPGASVYPTPPTVKKEVNTTIFGMT